MRTSSNRSSERFIAINMLVPTFSSANKKEVLSVFEEQINTAIKAGFTHAWINPICEVPAETVCHTVCLDTGINTNLLKSLYAPNQPGQLAFRTAGVEKLKEIIANARNNNFLILADFVWKHVSEHSSVLKYHGSWAGNKVKDIIEYNFSENENDSDHQAILTHLKKAIDYYLKDLGFAGLRLDAASHFPRSVRLELISYIRTHYPQAIIFEEVLFDHAQTQKISNLVTDAHHNKLYSDFVTTNLYYQQPDSFGALPPPEKMGDGIKIQLADQNGISFTGNHDHFSAGWSLILSMAAARLVEKCKNDKDLASFIQNNNVSPLGKEDSLDGTSIFNAITNMVSGQPKLLPENFATDQKECIRYLLPYANEIARELLDQNNPSHEDTFEKFQLALFERIANRTLASMSGYFILFSEISSAFETQRIFANQQQKLLLTTSDLDKEKDITDQIISKMKTDPTYKNNNSNFLRKTKQYKGKKLSEFYFWLPFIIDYLRNHPDLNQYTFYKDPESVKQSMDALVAKLGIADYIKNINEIFANLTTMQCRNYHTFTSSDKFKIIVRSSAETTDIIILNLNPDEVKTLNDIDLEKIALWHQSRLYSQEEACNGKKNTLSAPFDNQQKTYAPNGYPDYWIKKVGKAAFDDSYTQIIGEKQNHQTNLYLGPNLNLDLVTCNKVNVRLHIQTPQQKESDTFHNQLNKSLDVTPIDPSSDYDDSEENTTMQIITPTGTSKSTSQGSSGSSSPAAHQDSPKVVPLEVALPKVIPAKDVPTKAVPVKAVPVKAVPAKQTLSNTNGISHFRKTKTNINNINKDKPTNGNGKTTNTIRPNK